MKERPINLRAWEVRAILDGRKTQTRRVVKPQPEGGLSWRGVISCSTVRADEGKHLFTDRFPCALQTQRIRCPYGRPGDRLWVRESHYISLSTHDGGAGVAEYRADYCDELAEGISWRPSIHMPRWASRITLEVVSVRVERLNEISEGDAKAEGVTEAMTCGCLDNGTPSCSAKCRFKGLWESINGPGSWAENPFVWAVEFRRV